VTGYGGPLMPRAALITTALVALATPSAAVAQRAVPAEHPLSSGWEYRVEAAAPAPPQDPPPEETAPEGEPASAPRTPAGRAAQAPGDWQPTHVPSVFDARALPSLYPGTVRRYRVSFVGPPTPPDQLAYEGHAAAGERMVRSVAGVGEVAEIVGAHEERFDGTGYPLGLSGDDIPVESRIVACAAAHVKLAQILSGEALAQALKHQSGNALDPEIVTTALAQLARERSHLPQPVRDVPAT